MSANGDKLRDAADRLRVIADSATPRVCPQWTYSAVRHIARNCEIDCDHDPADDDGLDHLGWDRYGDAPWITAVGPQTAPSIVALLDLAAVAADSHILDGVVAGALAFVDAIAWPADQGRCVVTASDRPTREQVNATLRTAEQDNGDEHDARLLAAEVRALRAELDEQRNELTVRRLQHLVAARTPQLDQQWVRGGTPWRVTPEGRPPEWKEDGYAVVTADWSEETDRAEHYVAERMTRETAELLVAAAAARTPQPGEPSALVLAAEKACAAIEMLDPDATEGVAIWDTGPEGDYVPEEIERAFEAGRALMSAIDEATGHVVPLPAVPDERQAPSAELVAEIAGSIDWNPTKTDETLLEHVIVRMVLAAYEPRRNRSQRAVPSGEDATPCSCCNGDPLTVCAACEQHSCWAGRFMCEFSRTAGTKQADRASSGDAARHEIECPSCGATIRARMADAPDGEDESQLNAVTALVALCDDAEAAAEGEAQAVGTRPVPLVETAAVREALLAAATPVPAEPDDVHDGVEMWLVRDGLDVSRDATGRGRPTYRIGSVHVAESSARGLRDALVAALARPTEREQ